MAAIFATCYGCKEHIISYVDKWQDVVMKDGTTKKMKIDLWYHRYDHDDEGRPHKASPQLGNFE